MTMNNPRVAVVSSKIDDCKKISKVFKNIKTLVDSFDDNEIFLMSHLQNKYDLVIIKASDSVYQGRNLFDKAELNNTQRAFIVSSNEELKQIASIKNVGVIYEGFELVAQVRNVLDQFNQNTNLRVQLNQLQSFHDNYKHKQEVLIASLESEREKTLYGKDFFELCDTIKFYEEEKIFKNLVVGVFDRLEFVNSYSLLELNENSNKLVPTSLGTTKEVSIPAIWLGHVKLTGVNENGMNMLKNIMTNLVHDPVVTISLSENGSDITSVLALEVDRDYLFNFNWQVIETLLSGLYAQSMTQASSLLSKSQSRGPFELLSQIASTQYGRNLISIDVSNITDLLELRNDFTFDWQTFWKDMKINLSQVTNIENIYNSSFETIVLDVENDFFDESFSAVKDLCSKIRLAKYFTGKDKSILLSMSLNVSEVPYSEYSMVKSNRQIRERNSFNENTL